MRNEHIQRLKDEMKKSIAYSSGLERSVDYVGFWFQQISKSSLNDAQSTQVSFHVSSYIVPNPQYV